MKKFFVMAIVVVVMFVLSVAAYASNNVLEFAGGGHGKVVFDGKAHNTKLGAGKCMVCHKDAGFPMKKPGAADAAKITMADINAGKFCGFCHKDGGQGGFTAKDCAKCHKK